MKKHPIILNYGRSVRRSERMPRWLELTEIWLMILAGPLIILIFALAMLR